MDISATFAPAFQETESLEIDLLTETVLRTFFFFFYLPFAKRDDEKKKKEKKLSKLFGRYT